MRCRPTVIAIQHELHDVKIASWQGGYPYLSGYAMPFSNQLVPSEFLPAGGHVRTTYVKTLLRDSGLSTISDLSQAMASRLSGAIYNATLLGSTSTLPLSRRRHEHRKEDALNGVGLMLLAA